MKRCRVCDGEVQNVERGWVDLPALGRFWLCDEHRERCSFLHLESGAIMYVQEGFRFSLGPYPYEPSKLLT